MNILLASFGQLLHGIGTMFSLFADVWYFMLPPLLYPLFKSLWVDHIHGRYGQTLQFVLLEIVPPKELEKSPKLMESVFSGLAGVMKGFNAVEEFIQGQFPASFSLEIVSRSGVVHFYIRTQKSFRNLVEAHFYAQYPDMEISEVADYIDDVPRTLPNNDWDLWGTDFELVKPDLYPIKTYPSFEEEVTGKMIDPLAGVIEALGRLGPDQNMWLQFIISPERDDWYKTGQATVDAFLGKEKKASKGILGNLWQDLVDVFVNIIPGLFGPPSFSSAPAEEKKQEQPIEFRLSPGQKEVLKALESNLGKQMFAVRMRLLYVGRRPGFDKTNISIIMGALKQFNDQNLNGFKPNDVSKTYANYLFVTKRLRYRQRRIFNRYLARDPSAAAKMCKLSTEELATLFHMPDMSVMAPAFSRVAAKRSTAPSNLPILEE
mgnify:CR=1 FL=1